MSTTKPTPDAPNPGADPVNVLAPTPPGAPRADDHDTSGPPAPEVIKRGYEEDVYDSKSVISVPLLVILFFVLAFGTVTTIFAFISKSATDPMAHPAAAERNKAPLNDRMGRTHRGGEVDQPRLEGLKLRSGDSRAITRPELSTGNSPELHPEELRPTKERYPSLYNTGWTAPNKAAGRLSIDQAMSLDAEALKKLLPSREKEKASRPTDSQHTPTAANAGRGAADSQAKPPEPPKTDDKKPGDKK